MTWVCYHVIGDALRGDRAALRPGSSQRFAARLAAEPTVLAPHAEAPQRAARFAWAAAATVAAVSLVGWVAFGTLEAAARRWPRPARRRRCAQRK